MKTNILLNIIIGFLITSCAAQNERIEEIIMDCSYQSFADKGVAFKKLVTDYERLLVDEKILVDNSGKSYREVLQNIADYKEFDKVPSKFFSEELQKIERPALEKALKCQELILTDSTKYDTSKLQRLEAVITEVQYSGNLQPALVARKILEVLTEKDFELDYYKVRAFFLFSLIDTKAGLNRELPVIEDDQDNTDLTNALLITIDDKDQVFVNEKKVNLDELKTLVRQYESEFRSESVISLKNDDRTKYRTYVDVQNAIVEGVKHLREQLAQEKYKTNFDNLPEEQQTEIKTTYPLKFVE